jgi:deoxyribodipyrimidine photo-lyase
MHVRIFERAPPVPRVPENRTVRRGQNPDRQTLESLGIPRNPRIQVGGERAGRERLRKFLAGPLARYDVERDRLDHDGTSRLSADLKFGTLSVRTVWRELGRSGAPSKAVDKYESELIWREFAHHTLASRPELLQVPFRKNFEGFPYRQDETEWQAWVDGHTGYPLVDAAARQLRAEGYVHNRARMVAASFLSKHLLIHYQRGEAHYLEFLTDGDWAQNNAGWQWSAGSGCDAQPYFRVFNPSSQRERFDPEGSYVRRWVPEIDSPSYPKPIVDHALARERYLQLAGAHLRGRR